MMPASPISLLIVDDDPVFAAFVRQLVISLGEALPCQPEWADSAEAALTKMRGQAYELVLLDYQLPAADGLSVLDQIQNLPLGQQPAVVMLTGSGNEAVAVEAMKRGARDYLAKGDLDVPPLTRALTSALRQKRLAQQVAAFNAQMQADLEMARHLQQSLLPDTYPSFPRAVAPQESSLRFCHRFCPTTALAGDFFSVQAVSDTQAGVFIGDVMGHGVRSALVAAMLRALVADLAPRASDPGQFLSEMNRMLAGILKPAEGPMFATAFYLVADAEAGRMDYAGAGHPRPLHFQRGAGTVGMLEPGRGTGPALGLFESSVYATTSVPLAPGDLVLLFTDGLFEVADAQGGEDYGQKRLLDAARRRLDHPLPVLLDELLDEVRAFAGGAEFTDDVCLLGIEVARVGSRTTLCDRGTPEGSTRPVP